MRRILLFIMPVILMACSTPRYTYYFDHYDYSSGKKSPSQSDISKEEVSIFKLQNETLMADGSQSIILLKDEGSRVTKHYSKNKIVQSEVVHSTKNISREERKELHRELKKEFKKIKLSTSEINHEDHAKEMDKDLRLAIIFGAVGLTLSLFAGINTAFWVLGVIAIVVGVVFLVRWLLRQ